MPRWDDGKMIGEHLKMILRNGLETRGYDAKVYLPVENPNGYEDIYPEVVTPGPGMPIANCRIILGNSMEGLAVSDFIRLSDVTKEMVIVTDYDLKEEMVLIVEAPDDKVLNLRVVECVANTQLSTFNFRYRVIMT